MKTLAVIGKVSKISAIKGADLIVQAEVVCGQHGKWQGVVSKSMHVGQIVTVFLQDAILPQDARWAFMERHNWRVRMARFKGVPSECVIVEATHDLPVGKCVTEVLGVTKHEKPIPVQMSGDAVGSFPSFLPKTDEPNFQTVEWDELIKAPYYITEKADGTSCTAWVDETGLHVASRNWELREYTASGAGNSYWQVARQYMLEDMPVGTAVQFEVIGPGIQSNPMGLKQLEGRLFGSFKRDEDGIWKRIHVNDFLRVMPHAKCVLAANNPQTAEDLRTLADIKYANGKPAEGIVIRANDQSWSFKVINLKYKD